VPVNIDCLEESSKHIQGPLTQKKGIEQEITFHVKNIYFVCIVFVLEVII